MLVSFKSKRFKVTDQESFLELKNNSRILEGTFKLTIIDASAPSFYLLGYLLFLQKNGVEIKLEGDQKGIQLVESILQRN